MRVCYILIAFDGESNRKQKKGLKVPRPRKFNKLVPREAKLQPAVRVVFRGHQQLTYQALNRIAVEEEGTNQTELARRILTDWVKARLAKPKSAKPKQMNLILGGAKRGQKQSKA